MRVLIFAIWLLGCGGSTKSASIQKDTRKPVAHRFPQRAADVRIEVTAKAISFNGVSLSGQPKVTDIKQIYGEPDRTWDSGGANRIHTWDTLGLLVYEPYRADGSTGDGRCISATFPFKAMSPSFSPRTLFGGTIVFDNKTFEPSLALGGVLAWQGATQPYTKQSIVFDRQDFHVFTIEENAGQGLDLVEISFWQMRDDKPARPAPPVPDSDSTDSTDDCKPGDVPHCTHRALVYQASRKSFERAFELVKISCAGGDVFGCVMVGNMHDAGKGTPQNKGEAKTAWKRACTLGYKPACAPR